MCRGQILDSTRRNYELGMPGLQRWEVLAQLGTAIGGGVLGLSEGEVWGERREQCMCGMCSGHVFLHSGGDIDVSMPGLQGGQIFGIISLGGMPGLWDGEVCRKLGELGMRDVCSREVCAIPGGSVEVCVRRLCLWEVLERDGCYERGHVPAVSGVALFRDGE